MEGDLTPMIDMTFQLIAFFMVLINFSQSEQEEDVLLPKSVLAKPPDRPLQHPITIHVRKDGSLIYAGRSLSNMNQLRPYLVNERLLLEGRDQLQDATIVIRAHLATKTGIVQKLVQVCQDEKFETFALRAEEDVGQ